MELTFTRNVVISKFSILHKNDAIIPSGIFRCDIPTSNTENDSLVVKNNTLYVGLYTSGGINIILTKEMPYTFRESCMVVPL